MDRKEDIIAAEHEVYQPPEAVVAAAHIKDYDEVYARALADPEAFWAERAEALDWFEPWQKVLDESLLDDVFDYHFLYILIQIFLANYNQLVLFPVANFFLKHLLP